MTLHVIDKYHTAECRETPGGWRVTVSHTGGEHPNTLHTQRFPDAVIAQQYIADCRQYGVDACGICCKVTARPYQAQRRYVKPEFQEDRRSTTPQQAADLVSGATPNRGSQHPRR